MYHIDLFSGGGAMALATTQVLTTMYKLPLVECLYVAASHDQYRTLQANRPRLMTNSFLCDISSGLALEPCKLLTAQLFDGLTQAEYAPTKVDNSQVMKLVNAVEVCQPKCIVVGATGAIIDEIPAVLSVYTYLFRALRGLGYTVKASLLSDAQQGASHYNENLWIKAWKISTAPPETPTVTGHIKPLKLGQLLKDVPPSVGSKFSPATASKFREVAPGCCRSWKKYRRLSNSEVCPTLTVGASGSKALCHPTELRPLSVAEVKRVKGYPDSWVTEGTMQRQYKQLINGVNPITAARVIYSMMP